VQVVLREHVRLSLVGEINVVAQLAQRGQPKMSQLIHHQIAFGHRIDSGDDGSRAQPIYDLIFVAVGGSRVCRSLRNYERWAESAGHFFRDGDDVVAAGARISRQAVVVGCAETAKV
jgi:hypothetical protein